MIAGLFWSHVTEYVYDLWGRTAGAKRSGDGTWTCCSFDARGRTTSTVFSAFGASPARTATYTHAVGGNPLVSSAPDPVGTISTRIDLLGRTGVAAGCLRHHNHTELRGVDRAGAVEHDVVAGCEFARPVVLVQPGRVPD